MGRVSKRGAAARTASQRKVDPSGGVCHFSAGIYARLSAERRGDSGKESLETQIAVAEKYVEEWNSKNTGERIEIKEYYTDLGRTGSNFERPGFVRLLADIRAGKINCVVVKDLSRFGRNYLEAGDYIENIFPVLGVRFISVTDDFDTGNPWIKDAAAPCMEDRLLSLQIRNLVNDMYAKDFSRKAKISLEQRRKEGSYVGGPAPYGYLAVREGKRRVLVPDEAAADIVRLLYEKFVETKSYTGAARELSCRKINPPCVYHKTGQAFWDAGTSEQEYIVWHKNAVERIVKNQVYCGCLAQGKSSVTARDEKSRILRPKEEWVVIQDTHEPIISCQLFGQASAIISSMNRKGAGKGV